MGLRCQLKARLAELTGESESKGGLVSAPSHSVEFHAEISLPRLSARTADHLVMLMSPYMATT